MRKNGFVLIQGQYDLFRDRVLSSFDEFAKVKEQGWLVRTDIRSYYYSVDHDQLLKLIEQHGWLPDEADRDLLRKCLEKWAPAPGKGIPVGYECSDYMGNLYLNSLDGTLKDFRVHRYVDDTYIFVHDFEQVKYVLFKIDKALDSLGLQRNTSKTMTYRISDLPRADLQRMLRQSLSAIAEEKEDPVAEAKRQEQLLAILHESFDPHAASDSVDDSFADFRNVAFVLNRINRKEENIKDTAYYVLDHDLEHSYHALKYLTLHAPDDKLIEKLKLILNAGYEPRSLKALALYCLQKLGEPEVQDSIRSIVDRKEQSDWHLVRSILKQVVEPSLESFSRALLESVALSKNPHVEVYARWLIYQQATDPLEKRKQVDRMFVSGHQHLKKLGVYLAHRDGLVDSVDTSLLEPHLQSLFSETILNDIENFRYEFSEVFGISLSQDFPIGKFFGSMSEIAPIMRVIYATKEQGATQFVKSLHSFLEILLVNLASVEKSGANESDIDIALEILDDNRLYLLVSTLRGELSKDFAKEGIQEDLIGRFKNGIRTWFDDRLIIEEEVSQVRNQAFICYAREDEDWVDLLFEHWQPIEDHHQTLDIWSDKRIETGDHWREEIIIALAKAKIAVLFISRAFLASRFINKVELPAILKDEKKQELKIIWIPVSPSNVDVTPIAAFEAAWRKPEITLVDLNEGDRERHLILVTKKIAKHMGIKFNSSTSDSMDNNSTE
ncbi:MAG: reverse transcriptase domain-containing protein [Chloroflexi bacterium]|nr:reverse transcriptase domain-containing protein [Chloroflexota bacterium]